MSVLSCFWLKQHAFTHDKSPHFLEKYQEFSPLQRVDQNSCANLHSRMLCFPWHHVSQKSFPRCYNAWFCHIRHGIVGFTHICRFFDVFYKKKTHFKTAHDCITTVCACYVLGLCGANHAKSIGGNVLSNVVSAYAVNFTFSVYLGCITTVLSYFWTFFQC